MVLPVDGHDHPLIMADNPALQDLADNSRIRIGLVAGELSGDQLGAGLISSLRNHFPNAVFEGIGGPKMVQQGFNSLFALERLSVMGFVEPLKRLPELLRMRRRLYEHFLEHRFDLVVGIDSPDFNLGLECKLRKRGILTAHYVSPSVWAWRQGRIKKIRRAVDHMLTLLPFESDFYRQHGVPVTCVGHPLADDIPLEPDVTVARESLGLGEGKVLAVMPGSRGSEVAMMGPLFLEVMQHLHTQQPALQFVIPSANRERHSQLEVLLATRPMLPVKLVEGDSHTVMAAADAVLLTSGTTALEAMLLKKPMVVAYKMGDFSYKLLSRLVKTPYIALPNLLAGQALVPELIQNDATVPALTKAVTAQLDDGKNREQLIRRFTVLHQSLRQNASATAAQALAELIHQRQLES